MRQLAVGLDEVVEVGFPLGDGGGAVQVATPINCPPTARHKPMVRVVRNPVASGRLSEQAVSTRGGES